MEKLINVMLGALNWYEGTTIRANDPQEIADLKICERRSVGAFVAAVFFAGLSALCPIPVPAKTDMLAMALAPIFQYLSIGLALISLAAVAGGVYYTGRGIYRYIDLTK